MILILAGSLACSSQQKSMQTALQIRDYTHLETLALERLRHHANDPFTLSMMAKVFLAREMPDSALLYCDRAYQLEPDNQIYRQELLETKIIMGDSLLRGNLPLQATDLFQSAVKLDSSSFVAWQRLGLAQRVAGLLDEAQNSYLRAYRLNLHADSLQKTLDILDAAHVQSNLLMKKGIDQFQQQNYDSAAEILEQAIQVKPDNTEAHYYFHLASGCSYFTSSDLSAAAVAIDHFTQASSLRPEAVEPHFYLASIYAKTPNQDQTMTIREYETVIQLAPSSEFAQEARTQLAKLKRQ